MEARLWGLAPVRGAKTEDGLDIRAKMWQLLTVDCPPGSILAEVKSGVNIQEYEFATGQEGPPDSSSKRGLALELIDALHGSDGMNIGQKLVHLGLAKEEVREEKHGPGEQLYYVVRKESVRREPSSKLKLLRQHEAYLTTRLKQFKIRALTEKNSADSARFGDIRQRIEDFQSKLEGIQERRKMTEEEESV